MTFYLVSPDPTFMEDHLLTGNADAGAVGNDTPWVANGSAQGGAIGGGYAALDTALVTGWAHVQYRWALYVSYCDQQMWTLRNETNNEDLFRVDFANGSVNFHYHNGSTWVVLGDTLVGGDKTLLTQTAVMDFDLSWFMDHTVGYLRLYSRGQLVWSYEGDTIFRTSTDIDWVKFTSAFVTFSTAIQWSSFLVADQCTIGCHVAEMRATADGVTMDWDGEDMGGGGYLDVEHLQVDDATMLTSNTNGDIALFAVTDMPSEIANNWAILGIGVNFRAQSDGIAPQQIRAVLRSGGANYVGPTLALENGVFQGRHYEWQNDPDDTAPITEADANAFEIGFECVT